MQPKTIPSAMHLLIIDDEENIRRTTAVVLEGLGHETAAAENRAQALKQLEADHFDLAFLDLKLNGDSGLELLPEMLKLEPRLEVVVFTAYASIETAVEAMRRGAADYISA
jgi:NtrC-family two-component system response regulator AlgB